jgi:hypothetical protein
MLLDTVGGGLAWATYFGSGTHYASGVALDADSNILIMGTIYSDKLPVTPGAPQSEAGGGEDVFVTKFNPHLSGQASLVYATYLLIRASNANHNLRERRNFE